VPGRFYLSVPVLVAVLEAKPVKGPPRRGTTIGILSIIIVFVSVTPLIPAASVEPAALAVFILPMMAVVLVILLVLFVLVMVIVIVVIVSVVSIWIPMSRSVFPVAVGIPVAAVDASRRRQRQTQTQKNKKNRIVEKV
jgi:hypothetical protein